MIPRNIFQTHKSKEYIENTPSLKNALYSWKRNKHFNHYFSDDKQCEDFIIKFFPEIKDVYDRLPVKVMKADLWRYCIIYKYGGIYADTDTVLKVNPLFLTNHHNKELVVVPENNVHFCQWVFAAPPKSSIIKTIIDLSVERIRNMKVIKGEHIIHHLTGPGVFTDGINKYLSKKNNIIPRNGILEYENITYDDMYIFKSHFFHKNMVHHLFSGSWSNGWTKERDRLLK
tara:strand:- start:4875 stop:5561 length:687 start_codon:yes stop_codon:yes gene_type:complete